MSHQSSYRTCFFVYTFADFELILVINILEVQVRNHVYLCVQTLKLDCYSIYTCIYIKKYTTSHVSEGIHCFYFGFNDNGQQNKQMRWRRVKPQFEKRNQQLTHHIFAFWMQYRICIYIYIFSWSIYICVFLQTKFSDLEFSEQLHQYIYMYIYIYVYIYIFIWMKDCRLSHFCFRSFSLFGILRMESECDSIPSGTACLKVCIYNYYIIKMHIYIYII